VFVPDQRARDYLLRSSGFSGIVASPGRGLAIELGSPLGGADLKTQLSQLKGNEFISCRALGISQLYVRDGVVEFDAAASEIRVSPLEGGGLVPYLALETALGQALLRQGGLVVHALGFEYAGRGVLVVGPTMSGKTTLALSAALAGVRLLSDDRVLLSLDADGVVAKGFRPYLQIRRGTLQGLSGLSVFDWFAGHCAANAEVVHVHRDEAPSLFVETAWVRDVLFLSHRDRGSETRVKSVHQAAMLSWMVENSCPYYFYGTNGAEREHIAHLATLCGCLNAYQVSVGTDLLADPVKEFYKLMGALDV